MLWAKTTLVLWSTAQFISLPLNGLQPSMLGRNHQWPSSSCSGIGWGREKSAGKTASAGPCHNSTAQVNQGAPWQVPSDNFKDLRGLVEVEILPNRWDQIMVFVSLAHFLQKNYPAHQGSFICRTKWCWGLADASCSQLASLDVGRALDIAKQTAKQPQWTSTSQHPLCLLTPWWTQKKTFMTHKDWANHWDQARKKLHLDMPGTGPQALQPLDHGIIIQELCDFTTLEWREAWDLPQGQAFLPGKLSVHT